MKKIFILIHLCAFIHLKTIAQQAYQLTLEQCIDSALRKNISVRQTKLSLESANINVGVAKSLQLPDIYGNVGQGLNLGRNIDPFSNDYVNRTVGYGSYGITGNVVLFNGFGIKNNIRQNEALAVAAKQDVKFVQQQTILNVILAYMQVLSTQEQLDITKTQAEISNVQLKRIELKSKKGVVAASQVTDIKGQLLNDQLTVVDLQNNLEWYKMELAQLMNVPYKKQIVLAKINIENMMAPYLKNSNDIYATALTDFPQIKAAEERTKSSAYGLKAAKGLRYPQVFAGSNVQTGFNTTAVTTEGKISFSNQFANNRSANFTVGVRIPILANSVRNNIKLADINFRNNVVEEEKTKNAVWQQVERSYVAMMNAYQRYETLKMQAIAYNESYKATEARFNTGIDNTFNYLSAKSNLDRANINLINARYDLVLKKKALDFYQNIK